MPQLFDALVGERGAFCLHPQLIAVNDSAATAAIQIVFFINGLLFLDGLKFKKVCSFFVLFCISVSGYLDN